VARLHALDRIADQSHHGHDDFAGIPCRKAHSLSTREFLYVLAIEWYQLYVQYVVQKIHT